MGTASPPKREIILTPLKATYKGGKPALVISILCHFRGLFRTGLEVQLSDSPLRCARSKFPKGPFYGNYMPLLVRHTYFTAMWQLALSDLQIMRKPGSTGEGAPLHAATADKESDEVVPVDLLKDTFERVFATPSAQTVGRYRLDGQAPSYATQ